MKESNYNYNKINLNKIAIKSYFNPYENRKYIYEENRNKSGIYCWNNLINGKLYIGSSVNITRRLYCYLSFAWLKKDSLKYNNLINKAILKYDYFNFEFNILRYCNSNELIKWEQYYIDLLKPKYNILKLKSYKPNLEALTKLRLAKKLSGHTVIVINKNNNFIKKYNSINSAAIELNVTRQGINYCMKNKILLKNTYLIIKLIKIIF